MAACKLSPPEYDTSRHCGEHGGTAWLYGPNPHRCDRAPMHDCGDPQCPDWEHGQHKHLTQESCAERQGHHVICEIQEWQR